MKKIGILCLALVMALGTLGIGFAHWSGELFVRGTATTGTFDAELSIGDCYDSEVAPMQDIGQFDCSLLDDDGDGKMDTLEIIVWNGYPSYSVTCPFDVHCLGTIPIVVTPGTLTNSDPSVAEVIIDIPGGKIHQSEELWGTVTVHFLQKLPPPCPQIGPYFTIFTYSIVYDQAQ